MQMSETASSAAGRTHTSWPTISLCLIPRDNDGVKVVVVVVGYPLFKQSDNELCAGRGDVETTLTAALMTRLESNTDGTLNLPHARHDEK